MMKEKKDVLFLLQFFYPEYISSATLPFDTASSLVKEGFSVDVLCGYPHEYTDKAKIPYKEIVNQVHIKRVGYLQLDRKKALGRMVNYLSLTVSMATRLFSMKNYKTLIVYSNPPILPSVAALASKLFGCKLVFVAYDLYPEIALKT
ncbi:MAG: glycosyltransferase WbuB, partial [Clostridia bacterium]|nr:glycosyltransferase WbuB [Clostridia bacterium]